MSKKKVVFLSQTFFRFLRRHALSFRLLFHTTKSCSSSPFAAYLSDLLSPPSRQGCLPFGYPFFECMHLLHQKLPFRFRVDTAKAWKSHAKISFRAIYGVNHSFCLFIYFASNFILTASVIFYDQFCRVFSQGKVEFYFYS